MCSHSSSFSSPHFPYTPSPIASASRAAPPHPPASPLAPVSSSASISKPNSPAGPRTRSPAPRGHLVPAAGLTADPAAFHDSFLMSNVTPQDPTLNSGLLLRIENAIRRLSQNAEAVLVITGTLFHPASDPFPSHFFKAVLAVRQSRLEMYAVLVPNATPQPGHDLAAAATSVAHLERLTGLDFFPNLEDTLEHSLQAVAPILPAAPAASH